MPVNCRLSQFPFPSSPNGKKSLGHEHDSLKTRVLDMKGDGMDLSGGNVRVGMQRAYSRFPGSGILR